MLTLLSHLSIIEKVIPVLEEVAAQIGPTVQAEMKNGEQLVADVQNALAILKAAFDNIKVTYTPAA